jgi:hypothetical protein
MSLFKKKEQNDEGAELMKQLFDIMNRDGFEIKVFKCPNGCVSAIVSDWTDVPAEEMRVPVCPKCGSRGILA